MIAKNVGIRRAKGKFVVATNIDVLFSNELMSFLAKQQLSHDLMYRVDRFDVSNTIPLEAGIDEQMDFCWRNRIRTNLRGITVPSNTCSEPKDQVVACARLLSSALMPHFLPLIENLDNSENLCIYTVHREAPIALLHTNACGDFTLLSKEKWEALKGYPEFDAYSMHIDSLLCYMAHYSGILEAFIPAPSATFHIEHGVGSGWTPEGSKALFDRLDNVGIPYIEYGILRNWGEMMQSRQEAIIFNMDNWGLSDFQLAETVISDGIASSLQSTSLPCAVSPSQVLSLRPEYSLEKAQLDYLRKENRRLLCELQDMKAWIAEMEKGKAWLECELKKAVNAWEERGAWIEELEKAKTWLQEQLANAQKQIEEKCSELRQTEFVNNSNPIQQAILSSRLSHLFGKLFK
jgi:hypothetical protein